MPYWSPLIIDNAEIDLSHLEPFEFSIVPVGFEVSATVSVRFHDHCFTVNYDSELHLHPIRSSQASSAELRAFSAQRYELSKLLPGIIRQLDGQRIASTREGNMVRITLQDGRTYPVFFTLRRESARRAALFVVSAYLWDRPSPPATTGAMRFNVALAKVLRGEKPKFPAK
jgi:hypothetical protein